MKGAEVIFNMSADTENISKHQYLRSLLAQQSARCLAGYVFASSGFGESTTDVVFAGNAMIYENGTLLAEADRFSFDEQLVMSEIDIEHLRAERLGNTTFAASVQKYGQSPALHVITEQVQGRGLALTRPVEAHPDTLTVRLCGQTVSVSANLLFDTPDVCFGISSACRAREWSASPCRDSARPTVPTATPSL